MLLFGPCQTKSSVLTTLTKNTISFEFRNGNVISNLKDDWTAHLKLIFNARYVVVFTSVGGTAAIYRTAPYVDGVIYSDQGESLIPNFNANIFNWIVDLKICPVVFLPQLYMKEFQTKKSLTDFSIKQFSLHNVSNEKLIEFSQSPAISDEFVTTFLEKSGRVSSGPPRR